TSASTYVAGPDGQHRRELKENQMTHNTAVALPPGIGFLKRTFLMTGAIAQPRQSCQFLFYLMKNLLLYRSAWPENSERFLMKTLGGAVLQVDVEDPFEQSGPTHARCLPLRVSVLASGLGGTLCGAGGYRSRAAEGGNLPDRGHSFPEVRLQLSALPLPSDAG